MREQLNLRCPCPSDPAPEASISLGSLWGSDGVGWAGSASPWHWEKRLFPCWDPLLPLRAGAAGWLASAQQNAVVLFPAASERGPEQGRRARKTLRWLPLMNWA